jgi:outer membrane protein OmpA-like peptidoglycan-associated protein
MKLNLQKLACLILILIAGAAGCTSGDIDVPVNSSELADRNVAYRSKTEPVEVLAPRPAPAAKPAPYSVDAELKGRAEVTRAARNPVAGVRGADRIEPEKIVVVTPPPAAEDDVIDFIDTSYYNEDDEFTRAVANARARRGLPIETAKTPIRTLPAPAPSRRLGGKPEDVIVPAGSSGRVAAVAAGAKAESGAAGEEKGITFLSAVIYHSNTQADLSAKDNKALREVARFAKEKGAFVQVVGHASSRTKDMREASHKVANFDLSVLRAEKVRDVLVRNGVSGKRVSIAAVSDTEKIASESMPLQEAVNRRTEVYIRY